MIKLTDILKYNSPHTIVDHLSNTLHEISLSADNAVKTNGNVFKGNFTVGKNNYNYRISKMENNPYNSNSFYNVDFSEEDNLTSIPTGNAKDNYIKILSTMYKVILDFVNQEQPEYVGISSLDRSGYWNIYNNLTKTNTIPGYFRKNVGLDFTTKQGDKGKFIVLKKQ